MKFKALECLNNHTTNIKDISPIYTYDIISLYCEQV